MSLLQEMETHGLADCEFNRQLLQEAFKRSLNKARIQSIRFFLSTMTETKSYI
jgi:hypothetical protein